MVKRELAFNTVHAEHVGRNGAADRRRALPEDAIHVAQVHTTPIKAEQEAAKSVRAVAAMDYDRCHGYCMPNPDPT